jgi:hypothetical protein
VNCTTKKSCSSQSTTYDTATLTIRVDKPAYQQDPGFYLDDVENSKWAIQPGDNWPKVASGTLTKGTIRTFKLRNSSNSVGRCFKGDTNTSAVLSVMTEGERTLFSPSATKQCIYDEPVIIKYNGWDLMSNQMTIDVTLYDQAG